MTKDFFSKPMLNSPYEYPGRHWELDEDKMPTNRVISERRKAEFITPIPATEKLKTKLNNSFLLKESVPC